MKNTAEIIKKFTPEGFLHHTTGGLHQPALCQIYVRFPTFKAQRLFCDSVQSSYG